MSTELGIPRPHGLDGVPTTDEIHKPKDYKSDQEVRWCPGCGDYIVLNAIQSFLPKLGLKRENIVFISGIGCSSRFPYYLNTYGMHSIHGRAPAIATGLAVTRPDLSVWVVTGDGDALSIGGNHLIHALRRNVNLTILLFNNQIYGLTKGQYSPTSQPGAVTKSTPMGSVDAPFNPLSVAIGAEATFVARGIDSDRAGLIDILDAATQHRGAAFIEIYQNCPIFNDGAFAALKDKDQAAQQIISLQAGKPIRFGPQQEYALRTTAWGGMERVRFATVDNEQELITHDPSIMDSSYAFALSRLGDMSVEPSDPSSATYTPVGIFRQVDRPTYDDQVRQQTAHARDDNPPDLASLLRGKDTWTVT